MEFHILTIFPDIFISPFNESILLRAKEKRIISIYTYNIRDWTSDKHRSVDDVPYGGGTGMIMKVEPLVRSIEYIKSKFKIDKTIFLTPSGKIFNQEIAKELALLNSIILICGRYEGVDERISYFVDMELSIGDYILSGGEIASMVIVDVVTRLLSGALGNERSMIEESFENGLLEYPQWTRPQKFRNYEVPSILLSGDHKKIKKWRYEEALKRTKEKRPDLLLKKDLKRG